MHIVISLHLHCTNNLAACFIALAISVLRTRFFVHKSSRLHHTLAFLCLPASELPVRLFRIPPLDQLTTSSWKQETQSFEALHSHFYETTETSLHYIVNFAIVLSITSNCTNCLNSDFLSIVSISSVLIFLSLIVIAFNLYSVLTRITNYRNFLTISFICEMLYPRMGFQVKVFKSCEYVVKVLFVHFLV